MRAEAQDHIDKITAALALLRRFLDWDRAVRRLDELNAKVEDPTLWDNPKAAQEVMRERRRLDEAITATRAIERECADTAELIELAEMEGDEAGDGEGMTINLEPGIDLEIVTASKELPKDAFVLKPPADSKQVDDLAAAVQERFQEQMAEMGDAEGIDEDADAEGGHGKPHATVGKPAPDVELTLLDGGTVADRVTIE